MGRATKQQAADNRGRVVAAASELFRERGLDGVGIAELMAAAGLTHGGFYRQFGSKDALAGEACAQSMQAAAQRWRAILAEAGVAGVADAYLTAIANRCPMPSLVSDVARAPAGSPVRTAYADGVREFGDVLATGATDRQAALALLAAMVGAAALARAVDDGSLVAEIAQAVQALAGRSALKGS